MQLPTLSALLVASAYLGTGVQATFEQGKGAQITFYKDDTCANHNGEMAFWYYPKKPWMGFRTRFDGSLGGECKDFRQPQGSKSLKVDACWNTKGENWSGWCDCYFWDDWGCKGNEGSSFGTCLASRSVAGYQWKSARCYMLVDPK